MCLALVLVIAGVSMLVGRAAARRRGPRPQPDQPDLGRRRLRPDPRRRCCWSPAPSATASAGGARCSSASSLFGARLAAVGVRRRGRQLIAFRALTGIGGALIMPGTLSTITSVFPAEERARAVGIWAGFAGAGGTLGMLGVGLDARSVLVGVDLLRDRRRCRWSPSSPSLSVVPDQPVRGARRPRPAGHACCRRSASAALVLGIIEGPIRGWADAAHRRRAGRRRRRRSCAFVRWELRTRAPAARPAAVPLPRLRHRLGVAARAVHRDVRLLPGRSSSTCSCMLGYSPLKAAVALLPMTFVDDPDRRRWPPRCRRALRAEARRPRSGSLIAAGGMVSFATLDADSGYLALARRQLILGVGHRPGDDAGDRRDRQLAAGREAGRGLARSTTPPARSAPRSASP